MANPAETGDILDSEKRTAVLLVGGEHDLGVHVLRAIQHLFPEGFRQVLFVSIGVLDYEVVDAGAQRDGSFEGTKEFDRLREKTRELLERHVANAREMGMPAGYRLSIGIDVAEQSEKVCIKLASQYPRALFFVGKVVFAHERWYQRLLHRFMHRHRAEAIQERLEKHGFPVTVVPVVLPC